MNNHRKENARLLKLTEVLINRFPDLSISPSFRGTGSSLEVYAWVGGEIVANASLVLSLKTDYEIVKEVEKVYLAKKELENEPTA